jgi:hypothetical protein
VQLTRCFANAEAALHHEAVWLLFGAPRLWIFTTLEVQLEVHDVLHHVIERTPHAFLAPSAASGEPLLTLQVPAHAHARAPLFARDMTLPPTAHDAPLFARDMTLPPSPAT